MKKHTRMKTKTHKTHSCCGKVSCPSLPPSLFISLSTFLSPHFLLHVKLGEAEAELSSHSTSGADQRASWKLRPLGLLITIRLNSGSDSSQRMSLCLLNIQPLPPFPFLKRTTLTFKNGGEGYTSWGTEPSFHTD